PDGQWVAFVSPATNLVPGQEEADPLHSHVYLYRVDTGEVSLVSELPASFYGGFSDPNRIRSFGAPALSFDGRYLAYTGLVELQITPEIPLFPGQIEFRYFEQVFLYDRETGSQTLV